MATLALSLSCAPRGYWMDDIGHGEQTLSFAEVNMGVRTDPSFSSLRSPDFLNLAVTRFNVAWDFGPEVGAKLFDVGVLTEAVIDAYLAGLGQYGIAARPIDEVTRIPAYNKLKGAQVQPEMDGQVFLRTVSSGQQLAPSNRVPTDLDLGMPYMIIRNQLKHGLYLQVQVLASIPKHVVEYRAALLMDPSLCAQRTLPDCERTANRVVAEFGPLRVYLPRDAWHKDGHPGDAWSRVKEFLGKKKIRAKRGVELGFVIKAAYQLGEMTAYHVAKAVPGMMRRRTPASEAPPSAAIEVTDDESPEATGPQVDEVPVPDALPPGTKPPED